MPTVSAADYLANPAKHPPKPISVIFGDESLLRRLAITELRTAAASADDPPARWSGDSALMRDVVDELSTVSMFGGQRMVIIDDAADFVTANRPALEDYAARKKFNGVLLLDVGTWPKTTRLYKALDASGLQVDCKLDARQLPRWIGFLAQKHAAKLEPAAVEALAEMVGPELGLIDQELAKLAVSTNPGQTVTAAMVHELVGGWRAKTVWEMIDAALEGRARDAIAQLDRLLLAKEAPLKILAAIGIAARPLAGATRLVEQAESQGQRIALREALERAGVKSFVLAKAEQQLRKLGRKRAGMLYRWLLRAELDIKGDSEMPDRTILERLIVQLSAP